MGKKHVWVLLAAVWACSGACVRSGTPSAPSGPSPTSTPQLLSPTATTSPTITATNSPLPFATASATLTPTSTATGTPTLSPTLTATPTSSTSATPTPTDATPPPTPSCNGAGVMGLQGYQGPVSLAGGTVDYEETQAGASGMVSTLHFYAALAGNPPSYTVVVGLYSDNGGQPGSLLSSSNGVNVAKGWNTAPLNTPVDVTAGTPYWLAVYVNLVLFAGGGTTGSGYLVQNAPSLPASYGGGGTPGSGWFNLYADLCP